MGSSAAELNWKSPKSLLMAQGISSRRFESGPILYYGKLAEWFKVPVPKTGVLKRNREFESHTFRILFPRVWFGTLFVINRTEEFLTIVISTMTQKGRSRAGGLPFLLAFA